MTPKPTTRKRKSKNNPYWSTTSMPKKPVVGRLLTKRLVARETVKNVGTSSPIIATDVTNPCRLVSKSRPSTTKPSSTRLRWGESNQICSRLICETTFFAPASRLTQCERLYGADHLSYTWRNHVYQQLGIDTDKEDDHRESSQRQELRDRVDIGQPSPAQVQW